jgi:hypothetical protein
VVIALPIRIEVGLSSNLLGQSEQASRDEEGVIASATEGLPTAGSIPPYAFT